MMLPHPLTATAIGSVVRLITRNRRDQRKPRQPGDPLDRLPIANAECGTAVQKDKGTRGPGMNTPTRNRVPFDKPQ